MESYAIPQGQRRPRILPADAWEEWGKHALYFVTINSGLEECTGPGFDFYVINPNDKWLPVYGIARFFFNDHRVRHGWMTCGAAIVGSLAYVVSKETAWICDFARGSESAEWITGPSHPFPTLPQLISMRGNLYALCYDHDDNDWNSFQLLRYGESWMHLDPPPGPPREERPLWDDPDCTDFFIGMSCIGDSKIILHVSTVEQALMGVARMVNISDENHFLVFEFEGNSAFRGQWTRLKIRPYADWQCHPCPRFPPPDRSYFPEYQTVLPAGSPLLIPIMPEKLFAFHGFGDSDSSAIRLDLPQEVDIEWPTQKSDFHFESQLHTSQTWNLIHLGGIKYCIIAFPSRLRRRDTLFVFTFDLVISPGNEDSGTGCSDASAPTGSKFTAVNVRSNHRCSLFGIPRPFHSGKACTSLPLPRAARFSTDE